MRNTFEYEAAPRYSSNTANLRNRNNIPAQRSSSLRAARGNQSYNDDQENNYSKHSNQNMRNTGFNARSDNQNKGKNAKKHKQDEEEQLSSLSGFSGSENEDNHDEDDDLKFTLAPKTKKYYKEPSDDEEDEQEHQDIVLNPKDDIKAQFELHDKLRRKNEAERREREILAAKNAENVQNIPLKRPHSSHGVLRSTENMLPKYTMTRQKENLYPERPQTANVRTLNNEEGEDKKPVTFKAIYTKPIQQTLVEKKVFNYTMKNFKTIPKKSDPVSRYQAMNNQWKKSKFLAANPKMKEGRKLNLAERNQTSKPESVFHRYQPKYVFEQN